MSPTTEERGQAMLLVIGLVIICFAIAGLAVDIARAGLLRRTLQSAADSAATAAASELDLARYYGTGGASRMLDVEAARKRATTALGSREGIRPVALDVSSRTVRVEVAGRIRTSFLRLIGVGHLDVTARAAAQPVFGEG